MISLPLVEPLLESVALYVRAETPVTLQWRLFAAHPRGFWIPGGQLADGAVTVTAGEAWCELQIDTAVAPGYAHLAVAGDGGPIELGASRRRMLGPLSWRSHVDDLDAVAVDRREQGWTLPQDQDEEWGDSVAFPFSYWRRDGHGWGGPPAPGIAFTVEPPQVHAPAPAVLQPWERPTTAGVPCWVSAPQNGSTSGARFVFASPQWLTLELPIPLDVARLDLYLDSDLDRHLANLWYSHPPGIRAMATLVSDLDVELREVNGTWSRPIQYRENHLRRCPVDVGRPITGLRVTAFATHGEPSATVTDVRLWPR
jgi:hypothetical protein